VASRGVAVVSRWVLAWTTDSVRLRYDGTMNHEESKELWDRLGNETGRAYSAFCAFLCLPAGKRSVLEAYRSHVGNPTAPKVSDTFGGWSRRFAWCERAAAYDEHLERLRANAVEEAIGEQAKRHASLVEKARYETMEELSALHVGVMGYLENLDWSDSGVRLPDVIQIVKLKLDAAMRFEEAAQARAGGAGGREPEWTLDEQEFAEGIIREIEAEGDRERRAGEEEETSKS